MKCCDMNSGKLRSLIQLQRKTSTPDGAGGYTVTWAAVPAGGVWAQWVGQVSTFQFNSEEYRAMREVALNRYRAVIRFVGDEYGAPFYSEADRVFYRNRIYAIESLIDVEDRQQWLSMTLIDGRAS